MKTLNKVNNNIVELIPELKKADIICNISRLNTRNKTFLIDKNPSIMKLSSFISGDKSINKYQTSTRNLK